MIAVACGSWVGLRGLQAKAELESVQTLVSQLKAQALDQDIASVTVRPSFASVAQMTSVMWEQQFGFDVGGVIFIDPVRRAQLYS